MIICSIFQMMNVAYVFQTVDAVRISRLEMPAL